MAIRKQQKQLEQEQHSHNCRFCDEMFNSERALDRHMWAHGIYNEPILYPNEGPSATRADQRDFANGNCHGTGHICRNCHEEFVSLKSFSKHCCRSGAGDDDSSGLSLPSSPQCIDKGKSPCRGGSRTPPPPLLLTKEEHLANCLVYLSTARENPVLHITDAGECSTSGRKVVDQAILPPLSPPVLTQTPLVARQPFECKTCQKCFSSHQALGGHRASHKKVMGCFATRPIGAASNNRTNQVGSSSENMALAIAPFAENSSQLRLPKKKSSKKHECSICKQQFPSGQALGGHKRCHWMASNSRVVAAEPLSVVAADLLQAGNSSSGLIAMHPHTGTLQQMFRSSNYTLDLNMPAPMDDFREITLLLPMPTTICLQPGRGNESENALSVNIEEEAESKEVRLANLSDLIDINEREHGSTWLQIGIGSTANQQSRADQP